MEQKSLTLRIPAETHKKLKLLAAHYDTLLRAIGLLRSNPFRRSLPDLFSGI
jgi:hypothetical protein